jgi:Zn-dependent protease
MNEIRDTAPAVRFKEGRNRNLFLSVPSRIILNGEGAAFFLGHKRSLHRFETSDGVRRFGFQLEAPGFAWLKKLLIRGYVEKI